MLSPGLVSNHVSTGGTPFQPGSSSFASMVIAPCARTIWISGGGGGDGEGSAARLVTARASDAAAFKAMDTARACDRSITVFNARHAASVASKDVKTNQAWSEATNP